MDGAHPESVDSKRVHVHCPKALADGVRTVAKRRGWTMSRFVRLALAQDVRDEIVAERREVRATHEADGA